MDCPPCVLTFAWLGRGLLKTTEVVQVLCSAGMGDGLEKAVSRRTLVRCVTGLTGVIPAQSSETHA